MAAAGTDGVSAQPIDDRIWIQISGYRAGVKSDLRIDARNDVGTEIDIEADLKLDDRKRLLAISAGARLGRHWRVGADYYWLTREGEASLARELRVADVTYPVSANVSSGLSSDIYRMMVGYSFVRTSELELGAALGGHVTKFEAFVQGRGTVAGGSASTRLVRRELLAPLPTVGLYGSFEPVPRVTLAGRGDYFALKIGDYHGRLLNAEASVSYRVTRGIGIGAMYRLVRYRVQVERSDWEGRVGYRFHGPALFVEAAF